MNSYFPAWFPIQRVLVPVALIMSALAICSAASARETQMPERFVQRDYVWLTADQPSGSQSVKVFPSGRVSVHFEYNDRGRGPAMTTEMTFDDDGLLTSFVASGVNHMKGAVDERFEIKQGIAVWRSSLERGEAPAKLAALYLPVNEPPEYWAVLARAALARPEQRIDLLPAGTAHLARVGSRELSVEGASRTATLYEISGLDIAPTYVWLDESRELIGYGAGWFSIVRPQWLSHLSVLRSAQKDALDERIRVEAARFRQRIEQPIAIVGVRVLDVGAGRLSRPMTVLLRDGLIAAIDVTAAALPEDAHRIDGDGKTLMAALWDLHGHINPPTYLNYVASGVLNVRDMGNEPQYLSKLREDIASGVISAPDVHPMGFIDKRGPYSAPTGRLVETLDEARAAVRAYAAENHIGVKLYSSIDPSWVPVLANDARMLGLRTAGHIPAYMSPAQAIYGGYNEITHINMMLLQLIGDWTIDTRTPQRFIVPGVRGGLIDVNSAAADAFLDLMVKKNIAHDPTLATFMNQYRSRAGEIAPYAAPYADHLPASLRRSYIQSAGYNQGNEAAFLKTGENALKLIKRLHDRGIRILPGTDAFLPGFALVSELECYAQAGIPRGDILRLATLGAAAYMGKDDTLGSVEVGKRAYLMLIEGDPTRDLSALRKVDLVVKGRDLFRSRDILAAQGIRPFF